MFCVTCAVANAFIFVSAQSGIDDPQPDVPNEPDRSAKQLASEWSRTSIEKAAAIYEADAEKWRTASQPGMNARQLRESGKLWLILGDAARARGLFEKGLASIDETNFPDESALILAELSLPSLDAGNIEESRRYFDDALRLASERKTPEVEALANFCAGEFYYLRGELQLSEEHYVHALASSRRSTLPDAEARILVSLGYLKVKRNNYEEALELFKQAEAIYSADENRRGEAFTYIAIGATLMLTNERREAMEYYRKAEAMFPEDLDHTEHAALLNNIGAIYEDYGENEMSLAYRLKALQFFKKIGHQYGQLYSLHFVGKLGSRTWADDSALKFLEEGRQLAAKLRDEQFLGLISEDFGNHYSRRNEFETAIGFFDRALTFFDKPVYKRQRSRVLVAVGKIYQEQGDAGLAKANFEQSLTLSLEVKDKFGEADALYHLAKIARDQNDLESAVKFVGRSVEITESLYADALSSRLRTAYLSNTYDRYELQTHLLMRSKTRGDKEIAKIALRSVENSKMRSVSENLARSEIRITADVDPTVVQKEKQIRLTLDAKSDQLTDLIARDGDRAEIDRLDAETNELGHKMEEIKTELDRKSPIYSAMKNPAAFDIEKFQAEILDDDTVLLEFSLLAEESYLWVVERTRFASFVLPKREQIEARVERLRGSIRQNVIVPGETVDVFQKRFADAEMEYQREAGILSNELFGPAAERFKGKRLIIVTDGKLQYFPLGALPFPGSEGEEPIVATNEVVYAPSAAVLMLIRKISASGKAPEKDLLLVTDPVVSKADRRLPQNAAFDPGFAAAIFGNFRSFDSLDSLTPLPASADEGSAISEAVKSSATTVKTGFAASRDGVLNSDIEDYRVMHFATHGLVDERRPELSGIVLSLFDEAGAPQTGGLIRMQDIYGMRLKADLVVLSACDTGLGKEIKGEGLLSLNNAFLQAGAKSVVSSLWKVDDVATKELMTEFYREMADGDLTAPDALRRAQLKLREDPRFRSPFYWASFTAQGDFTAAPKFARPGSLLPYAAFLSAAAIGGLYIVIRRRKWRSRKTTRQ